MVIDVEPAIAIAKPPYPKTRNPQKTPIPFPLPFPWRLHLKMFLDSKSRPHLPLRPNL